ncbi:MAG: hypothetical protein JSW11_19450 [Candidatus Heimdallarchaeota archaeon]|nr:MAG: hypothetical protein JSW11_19450 [Candidatus Heimdallarchaeota archaeon]
MIEVITQTDSDVPLLAILVIVVALIAFFYLMTRLGLIWRQQKNRATFNLFLSFTFYFIAIFFVFSTKAIDFLTNDLYQVATIGINLGYAFSLIGNVFLYYFTENIFFEKRIPYLREIITFGNGITLGFLTVFIVQIQTFPFLEIPGIYIPPQLLIWHVIISSIGFSVLLICALKSSLQSELRYQRAGFLMIAFTAVFELLVFVFFFVDRFSGAGFTIYYYLAWISASFAGIFAMVGYLLPSWFRRIFA